MYLPKSMMKDKTIPQLLSGLDLKTESVAAIYVLNNVVNPHTAQYVDTLLKNLNAEQVTKAHGCLPGLYAIVNQFWKLLLEMKIVIKGVKALEVHPHPQSSNNYNHRSSRAPRLIASISASHRSITFSSASASKPSSTDTHCKWR